MLCPPHRQKRVLKTARTGFENGTPHEKGALKELGMPDILDLEFSGIENEEFNITPASFYPLAYNTQYFKRKKKRNGSEKRGKIMNIDEVEVHSNVLNVVADKIEYQ